MNVLFQEELIKVRMLEDCEKDYTLLTQWLSDLDVCAYYEGRTKPFTYQMVVEKFEERAKGLDIVVVGLIEYDHVPIGFLQFYPSVTGEYEELDIVDMSRYKAPFGMDIVIGHKDYWNRGIGSRVMALLTAFLFEEKKADLLFIAPQTWNKRAIACYEKSGFKPLKIIKDMELHDDEYKDGLLMIKTDNQPFYYKPLISGDQVWLRYSIPKERTTVYEWFTNEDIAKAMLMGPSYPDHPLPSQEEFFEDYEAYYFNGACPEKGRVFIIMREEEPLGMISYASYHLHGKRAELDIWLKDSKVCGQGLGSQAIELACSFLAQHQGIKDFVIRPSKENQRAINAYQKAGFRPVTEENFSKREIFAEGYGDGDYGLGKDILLTKEL